MSSVLRKPVRLGLTPSDIHTNTDLRLHNTLSLPAKAEFFATFHSVPELLSILRWTEQHELPLRILGGGSNVLMRPLVSGVVLRSGMRAIQPLNNDGSHCWVAVDAGVNWHDWVVASRTWGFGLENLALIPGTVGASPIQNIGAYGVEVADCIEHVEGIQRSTQQWHRWSANDCRFGYRDSLFKHELADDVIITRVVFRLSKHFQPTLSYGPLQSLQEQHDLTPEQLVDAICRIRRSKLPDPASIPNAGSFFKNPLVSNQVAQSLLQQYPTMPVYWQPNNQAKLAAGWLIEQVGWRGRGLSHAKMHDQQALVLTTDGNASLADVEALQVAVQGAVMSQFSVTLEPEPQYFG
ncbi:MAG: UDP-N-acetylmuramate dehydrogenase [Bacterioplanes sp.]|nr:UDP-N-acetylmuramate dehydrogenase [Bacterioplanes sp.]